MIMGNATTFQPKFMSKNRFHAIVKNEQEKKANKKKKKTKRMEERREMKTKSEIS